MASEAGSITFDISTVTLSIKNVRSPDALVLMKLSVYVPALNAPLSMWLVKLSPLAVVSVCVSAPIEAE